MTMHHDLKSCQNCFCIKAELNAERERTKELDQTLARIYKQKQQDKEELIRLREKVSKLEDL